MVYKLEISKYCSSNERVRIKEFIKSQKGYAYKKTEKPGRIVKDCQMIKRWDTHFPGENSHLKA